MTIQFQTVECPFIGLDTKTDEKQLPLGKLLILQNAVFTTPGKLRTRNGYAALTSSILGGGTLAAGSALFTRDNELCLVGGTAAGQTNLYSYDKSNTAWASRGTMPSVTVGVSALANLQYTTLCVDMAQAPNGLQCVVYEMYDQNAASGQLKGIGYTIVDSQTGQVVVPPTTLDATASSVSPHVVVLGTTFVVYYIQGDLIATSGLYGRTIDSTAPLTAPSAATQLTSGTTTSAMTLVPGRYSFDAYSTGSIVYLSINNRSNGTTVFRCTSALAVASTVNIAATNSINSCVFTDPYDLGNVILGFVTGTTATAAVFNSTLGSTILAASTVDTAASGFSTITGCTLSIDNVVLFVGNTQSGLVQFIRKNTLTTAAYTVGTASTLTRQLNIAAKPFVLNPGSTAAAYLPAWFCANDLFHQVTPQNTIFVLDVNGNIVAKALSGSIGANATAQSAGNTTTFGFGGNNYQLPATILSGSTAVFPTTNSLRLTALTRLQGPAAQSFINYQFGAVAVSLNFADSTNGYLRAELAKTVHTSGGLLRMYDGANVVEHGFLIYPFSVTAASLAGGGAIQAGIYSYAVTYEWMDAQGQVHRSAPSVPVAQTAIANDRIRLTIPTLRVTSKSNVLIQVWRTLVNGSTYFQLTNFGALGSLFNDKTVDTILYTDGLNDTSISSNPQLYTTGNELQANPPPPAGPMCVHRNRLVVVDTTNPTQVWVSKQVLAPAPVELSGFLVLNIDPKGGAVTAVASLDDKLIFFKKDRVFMVLGQGPDSTGGQNDFTDAILVSADVGCSIPKSVLVVPNGIMFQSAKGIYLLGRDLNVSYIGAPVDALTQTGYLTTGVVGSSVLMPGTQQVRFAVGTISTIAAVYDYFVGQWSVFSSGASSVTAQSPTDAVLYGNVYTLLWSNGLVWQETDGVFADPGSTFIGRALKTGWIKLGGLQNFQRARRLQLLGSYKTPHSLLYNINYNYGLEGIPTQFGTITATTDYQFGIALKPQKIESVQVYLQEQSTGTIGECSDLSGMAFEIGFKKGPLWKLPSSQRQ